jgi:hypothetical protein
VTSTIYGGSHVAKARKPWTKRKKLIVGGVVAGSIALGGGTAWAAYALYGFGTIDSAAATVSNLQVDNASAQLTGKLLPGTTVGAKAVVKNTNDFPVIIQQVLVKESSLAVTPNVAACQQSVHIVGTPNATWPGEGGGNAYTQPVAEQVQIAAGQSAWVTVTSAVSQDASAEQLCGVKAEFAVKAVAAPAAP